MIVHQSTYRFGAIVIAAAVLAASNASAADKLRVGKSVGTTWTFIQLDVGLQQGIFAKYGIDLEVAAFSGDAKLQQAMAAGALDAGLGSGPSMAFSVKGSPVIAVAAFANEPRNISVTVPIHSPAKSAADLKGKLIAVSSSGSLTDWLAKRLAVEEGWGPEGVRRVAIGDAVQMTAALKSQQVDGLMGATENGYQLEERGEGRVLLGMEKYVPHFVTHVIFANRQLVAEKPDVVGRFLKGFFASMAFMKANKEKTGEIAAPVLHESPAVLSKTYDYLMPMMGFDGQFDPQGLDLIKTSFLDMGILDQKPSDEQILTRQFLPVKP
jgi:ABC-type nitrate/sulfonate/bicarbonate transport system substrate-binding protein